MPEKFIVDGESVRGLAKLLEETGLTEIEYQVGTKRIRVVREGTQTITPYHAPPPPPPNQAIVPDLTSDPSTPQTSTPAGDVVSSPMVGTAYLSSEPDASPFVKVGDIVKKGDTLLIIEAMKVMNPIRAPRDGKILEVCVEDSNPVEFEEPLVVLG